MRLFLHTKKIALVRFPFTSGSHRIGFSASGVRIRSASECIGLVSVRPGFGSDRLRFAQGSNRPTSDHAGSVSVCSGFGPDPFDFPSGAFCFCVPPVRGRLGLGAERADWADRADWAARARPGRTWAGRADLGGLGQARLILDVHV